MQDISKFIVENWQPLTSAILSVIAVIIVLIKKRPSADSLIHYIEFVCSDLPLFILEAERTGLSGDKKKQLVLDKCLHKLHKLIKITDEDHEYAKKIFDNQLESILNTPRKKDK